MLVVYSNISGLNPVNLGLFWHCFDLTSLHLHQIMSTDRTSCVAWCVTGNCFSLQKDHDTSIKMIERAVQINPEFTYAHTLLGHEYLLNEEFDQVGGNHRCCGVSGLNWYTYLIWSPRYIRNLLIGKSWMFHGSTTLRNDFMYFKATACFRAAIGTDARHYNAWYFGWRVSLLHLYMHCQVWARDGVLQAREVRPGRISLPQGTVHQSIKSCAAMLYRHGSTLSEEVGTRS